MAHTLALLPPVVGLSFNEAEHKYTVEHKHLGTIVIPSTTQVMAATGAKCMNYSAWRHSLLRNGIVESEADADAYMEQHRKHRAGVGTDFHRIAQLHLTSGEDFINYLEGEPESFRMHDQWEQDFYPRIGKVLIVEQPMLHRAYFYCGTPDLVAEIDGELTLCDWKTQQAGKEKIRTEWQLQVGAYARLIEHCYGITLRKAAMVIVTTDAVRVQSYNYADIQQGWQRYAGFLVEYHALQAKLGSLPNHIALTAMENLFR
jgi:hypothetical protein